MKTSSKLAALIALACATMVTAQAATPGTAPAFINPDWANSAWYLGAGIAHSRANIDIERISRSLAANGSNVTRFDVDQRDIGFKLYAGRQLNQYFAVEGGYFDSGKFDFAATATGNGVLRGETGFRGVNVDLVGQLPLTQRLSLLGRAGIQYARASTHFSGNRLNAVTNPNPSSDGRTNPKVGLGVEYKLTEALALRGEVERYRVDDAVGNRGDIDLASVNLVYKFGRPVARAYVAPEPMAAAPQETMPVAPAAPAPAPAPVSEKVSFAVEALFDFNKSIVKPDGKAALDDLMTKLQGMNTEVMIAVGHTDSIGSDAYNDKLSLRRADAVKAYLVSKGLDQGRLYTEGKGEAQPVSDNAINDSRARNRRVAIEVVGTRSVTR
jgi:OOP family OmpA-OmpF porin